MTLVKALEAKGGRARLPNFLVIGATKCGTTSLHDWLSRHPDVFMSPYKEMRFFLPQYRWDNGLDWYATQFADAGTAIAVGEASNGYGRGSEHAGVPERVAHYLPDVRLIYLVRHPMRRLISHYRHRLVTGREHRSLTAAIAADPVYVQTGCYGAELARWHAVFDAEQILVARSEHLFADPQPELARIAKHIGVRPASELSFAAANAAASRNVMPPLLRRIVSATGAWRVGKAVSARLQSLPGMVTADAVKVHLTAPEERRLRDLFAEDRKTLLRYVPPDLCDWDLT